MAYIPPIDLTSPWLIAAILWSIPWKGVALWRSARNRQKIWFIALLLVNTLALLEIIYLAFFQNAKKRSFWHPKKKK